METLEIGYLSGASSKRYMKTKKGNYQYLIQATEDGSVTRNFIERFLSSGTNYLKVIEQMNVRFASDEFLREVYVLELLFLILKQITKTKAVIILANIYDIFEIVLKTLESLGANSDKCAVMLFPLVAKRTTNTLRTIS